MARRSRTRERSEQETTPSAEQSSRIEPTSLLSEAVGLKVLVFTAGAVLMGLEIAGSRVLAPYFGNSVFVWGSLISIFLVALSAGYYYGGRIADRHPSHVLLGSICAAVSLLIFAVALAAPRLCGALVDAGLGERGGPLLASLLLFLPPSVGMGMVSPFAIRLATHSVASVGKIAGSLYALSTAGSIAGTLLTTFVLIPSIGVSAILKGLALALLLSSVVTLPFWTRKRIPAGLAVLAALVAASFLWTASPSIALERFDRLVVDVDTPYHHISVVDNHNKWNTRRLHFDRYMESAIVTSPPYPSLCNYTSYFHLALLAKPKIERALFIGAGGGIGPRAFHAHDPQMAIDVVDIDPKVLELARTHFFLDDSPKIKTIAEDGRMFVRRADARYDCIILDAFSAGGRIPFHLVTREFLEQCREKMTPDGVFVMNINSAVEGPLAGIFRSMYRTIDAVFPNTYVFAVDHRQFDPHSSMNIILVGTCGKDRIAPQQWSARANSYQSDSCVKADHVRQMLGDLREELPDMSGAAVFTDDYAPIETMPF